MRSQDNDSTEAAKLRRQAERIAREKAVQLPEDAESISPEKTRKMVHELLVYQIELEMQNEELRRSQADLDAARERYFDLYNMAPVGYFTINPQGLILDANLTAAGLLGVTRGALVNQLMSRFIFAEDRDAFYLFQKKLFTDGCLQVCDLRILKKDRMIFWGHIVATAVQDDAGATIVRAALSDISAAKQAEAALRESKEQALRSELRLEKAQAVAKVGDWVWDITRKEVEWSDEMYRIFGIEKGSYTGRLGDAIAQVIHPDDMHLVLPANAPAFLGKKTVEYRIIWPDGSVRHIWAESGEAILDEDGNPIYLTGIAQDITDRKQIEEVHVFMARTSGGMADGSFFQTIAAFLAECLGMDYVCIDRLEGDGLNARTVAVWCDGHFEDNLTYALKDTPCGEVVGKGVCCFPASVCQFFPRDQVLQDLRAESYIGVTLFDHLGRPNGLIAVISRRPLTNNLQTEAIIQTVGLRVAAELERLDAEQALRQSEERFRGVLDHMQEGVLLLSYDWRYLYINKAAEIQGRRPADELLGRTIMECWPGIESSDFYMLEQRVMVDRVPRQIEDQFTFPDGKEYWFCWHVQPALEGLLVITEDITLRKRGEAEIRTINHRLKLAQEVSKAGTWDWDIVNQQFFWSEEFFNIFRMAPNTIPGFEAWTQSLHPDDVEMASRRIQEALDQKTELLNDYRLLLPGNEVRWIRSIGNTIYNGDKPIRMLGLCLDITELKEVEETLRQSEIRFRTLFEKAGVGVLLVETRSNCFIDANQKVCDFLGYTKDEMLKMGFSAVIYPDDAEEPSGIFRDLLDEKPREFSIEKRFVCKDGQIVWGNLTVSPLVLSGGAPADLFYIVVIQDITERKLAETKIHEQLEELKRWHTVTMGREERIMELKREVNGLLAEAGKSPHYGSVTEPAHD